MKAHINTSVNMQNGLLIKIWDQEYIPSEWRQEILVRLAKKGDLSLCKNYREIMLLSTSGKQSLEWRTTLGINFTDYEKAFDSLDRNVLWDLMANYGIPSKIISLVKNTYERMNCRILHEGGLTEALVSNQA